MQKIIERTGKNGSFRGTVEVKDNYDTNAIVTVHYGRLLLFKKEIKNRELYLAYVEDAEQILSKHLEVLATQKNGDLPDMEKELEKRGYMSK